LFNSGHTGSAEPRPAQGNYYAVCVPFRNYQLSFGFWCALIAQYARFPSHIVNMQKPGVRTSREL
jgi:hypothetical protein